MQNGNETWNILKSIYVEETLIMLARITYTGKNAIIFHIVVFFSITLLLMTI